MIRTTGPAGTPATQVYNSYIIGEVDWDGSWYCWRDSYSYTEEIETSKEYIGALHATKVTIISFQFGGLLLHHAWYVEHKWHLCYMLK